MKNKKILFVAAECTAFAATGGLAEVAGSLPKAIMESNKSYKVKVVMPLYKCINDKYSADLKFVGASTINLAWRELYVGVFSLKYNDVDYYFIDNKYYFDRDSIYGDYDDGERFAFFSKSVFKAMEIINFYPDIIHCNDWHTALVNIYLDVLYKKQGIYMNIKSIFTIHNIEYQGVFDLSFLSDVIGIDNMYQDILEYNGLINLVKGAIVCSDLVTTVSPRYSREITTANYAYGLENIIRIYKNKVLGIINGIDIESYNPLTDKIIYQNYDVNTFEKKKANKVALQKELGLIVDENIPMFAVISRLVSHKGIELIIEAIKGLIDLNSQVVVLGTGVNSYEERLKGYEIANGTQVRILLTFNNGLARKIYSASDLFIMPSKSEPCGLSQMIASRYGSIPIVRATGGLYDTIEQYDWDKQTGNGFVFKEYTSNALYEKGKEALYLYKDKEKFIKLAINAMEKDFSWQASSVEYIKVYNNLLK